MKLNDGVIEGVTVEALAKFETYHLSQGASIITDQVPGPRSSELLKRQQELEGKIVSYPIDFPVALDMAKGAVIQDVDGNQFIDFFSMAGVLNLGHCNPDIIEAVQKQQSRLVHALDFPTYNKMKLIENILSALPNHWQDEYKINFCASTGSDAIEAAIKLAKQKTGRETIIAFQGGYHGMTSGALSITSGVGFRNKLNGLIPGVHFIPYSYCYRCPFGKNPIDCKMDCADFLESLLLNPHSGIKKPAAVVLEPIQGEGGIVVPQNNYLTRMLK
ncbi:MAG: aspartate aminotransferase family protein, partial [Flammeovirgaceae bacterium]